MSDALSLMRMRGRVICAADYAAPWSLGFSEPEAYFHIIERGTAWLVMEGQRPVRLEPGDLALLPLGTGHVLASDPALKPVPLRQALAVAGAHDGLLHRIAGDGHRMHAVCGRFIFAGVLAPRLLSVLPPLIHVEGRDGSPMEWLRLTSRFLVEESRNPRPGSVLMIERLLELLFIQSVREWAARGPQNLGWLGGLRDPQVGRALSAIHEDPARDWTVAALARVAGLSRSAFAPRFGGIVGQTPQRYISAWRLDLAADQLRSGTRRIADIARDVGYGSEAALTRAFRARFGTTPAQFRRSA